MPSRPRAFKRRVDYRYQDERNRSRRNDRDRSPRRYQEQCRPHSPSPVRRRRGSRSPSYEKFVDGRFQRVEHTSRPIPSLETKSEEDIMRAMGLPMSFDSSKGKAKDPMEKISGAKVHRKRPYTQVLDRMMNPNKKKAEEQ